MKRETYNPHTGTRYLNQAELRLLKKSCKTTKLAFETLAARPKVAREMITKTEGAEALKKASGGTNK